jgi:hypothetical protein
VTETRAVVSHNVVAMRAEPQGRAEQISQAIFGETVRVLRDEGDYTEINTPDNYQGWALTRHLAVLETGEKYPDPTRAAMVAPLFLPVFKQEFGQSERLTLLTLGTAVELGVGDPNEPYYPIRMPNGSDGYLEANSLIIPQYPARENLGPNLAVVAKGWIGVPYEWGGRTTFGIDCSGFVQRVYWLCGHVIPRDAYQQARWEQFDPVERGDLQAGDLIFFAGPKDPRGRIVTHVGMALGDGRFIHASSGQGVAFTPLEEEPYNSEYWGARRLSLIPPPVEP